MNEQKTSTVKRVVIIVLVLGLVIACLFPVLSPFISSGEKEGTVKEVTLRIVQGEEVAEKVYQTSYLKLGDFLTQTKLVKFKTGDYGRYVTTVDKVEAKDNQAWVVTVNGESIKDGVDFTEVANEDTITLELVNRE